MSTLAGTDAFVVNRAGVNYQVTAANFMSTVADTDLFVVNRGSVNYKVTGLDVKAYLGGGAGGAAVFPFAIANGGGGSVIGCAAQNSSSIVSGGGSRYYANNVPPLDSNTYTGYQVSTDGGKTWSRVNRVGGLYFYYVVVADDGSLIGAATTATGAALVGGNATGNVYRSTNNGGSWTSVIGTSLQPAYTSIVKDPTNGKLLVVSTNPNNFFESVDNGQNWSSGTLSPAQNSNNYTDLGGSLFGYNNKWYYIRNTEVYSFPQGSSGAVTATGVFAAGMTINAIAVSRGLGV